MANLRATRSMLLAKTDAVVARHRDEKDMGGATTLTDAQFAALLKERQRLRDITEDAAALKDPWKTHLGLLEQLRGK